MFCSKDDYSTPIEALIDSEMFIFKGKQVNLALKDFHAKYTLNEVTVLDFTLLGYIVYSILKYINIQYGRTKNNLAEKARIV